MPFSLNGIGTTYYGQRDFLEDGSYITTEWFIFIYIPVVPLASFRVLPIEKRWFVNPKKYWVWNVPLCKQQVKNTYLALLLVVLAIIILFIFAKNEAFLSIYIVVILGMCTAWLITSYSKRTKVKRTHAASSENTIHDAKSQVIYDNKDSPENPFAHYIDITVTESQLEREEIIQIKAPFMESTIFFQLKPEMRNKNVRLRGVFENGAGNLFVRVCISGT